MVRKQKVRVPDLGIVWATQNAEQRTRDESSLEALLRKSFAKFAKCDF